MVPKLLCLPMQAYLWMLFNYLLPAVIMISSHAYVIHVLRHPTPGQQRDRQVQNNVRRLILTTSLMAGLLTVLHFYEAIRYILANSNVIRYAAGAAIQQVGALLITLSALLNPCVLLATCETARMQDSPRIPRSSHQSPGQERVAD
ncbi:hypothetical protein T265_08745 [Opisthorchis viverrini]|uniref:G-protein coupled receptors family 1 profile domain-containing protein n=1 Tax=Opisthorchis viverrini TaxID=6198 RepID=A0A074Z8C9_OPIVI|nr:hypothetical protein T265_08745 [Opisthorchis viverrini]KER23373.1 hypothetical protein T265_08745 [Opisthorchis viverrini]